MHADVSCSKLQLIRATTSFLFVLPNEVISCRHHHFPAAAEHVLTSYKPAFDLQGCKYSPVFLKFLTRVSPYT